MITFTVLDFIYFYLSKNLLLNTENKDLTNKIEENNKREALIQIKNEELETTQSKLLFEKEELNNAAIKNSQQISNLQQLNIKLMTINA